MNCKYARPVAQLFLLGRLFCATVLLGCSSARLQSEPAPSATDSGLAPLQALTDKWTPLFDDKLSQWDSWVGVPLDSLKGLPPGTPTSHDGKVGTPLGLNNDPTHIFTVKIVDGEPVLHITGDVYGCIITKSSYMNDTAITPGTRPKQSLCARPFSLSHSASRLIDAKLTRKITSFANVRIQPCNSVASPPMQS